MVFRHVTNHLVPLSYCYLPHQLRGLLPRSTCSLNSDLFGMVSGYLWWSEYPNITLHTEAMVVAGLIGQVHCHMDWIIMTHTLLDQCLN